MLSVRQLAVNGLAFGASAAYVPFIRQAATAPRWALLSVGIPLVLWLCRGIRPSWLLLAFLGLVLVSVAWAPLRLDAVNEAWKWLLIGGAFAIGSCEGVDSASALRWCAWGLVPSSVLAICQTLGWSPIAQVISPSGLFGNKNSMEELALLLMIPLVWQRRWLLAGLAAPTLLLPGHDDHKVSHGVVFAGACVVMVLLWQRSRDTAFVFMVTVLLALGTAVSLTWHSPDVHGRLGIWEDTLSGVTWMGRGVGQFYGTFPLLARHSDTMVERPSNAHDDPLEVLYEFGFLGLGLLGLLVIPLVLGEVSAESLVLVAFLAEGMFAFPLHDPATAFVGAFVAGAVSRRRSGVCGMQYAR